jgi:sialate O-acetylesterase
MHLILKMLQLNPSSFMKRFYVLLFIYWITLNPVFGNVRLPGLFSNNMVLQRDMCVPVWGWADPGEKVTVELGGHFAETITSADGRWKLSLGHLDSGGPFQLIVTGKNTLTIQNVLVGEVWVCSGQSNMAMEVKESANARLEISSADYPQIRQFQVKRTKSLVPLEDVSPVKNPETSTLNKWEVCDSSTVGHFTAVGYYFSINLYKKLKVPIGLIHASWGGTTAEAWTPRDTLESDPELNLILKHWPDYNNDEEWLKEEYGKFVKEVETAQKQGITEPLYFNQPSVLFNGIIAPLIPYAIRGVAWYQGESNTYRSYQYRTLLPALIKKWRNIWREGTFPFMIVQLANYSFEPQVFPELREAQAMALSVPRTNLIVTIDLGDSASIHPLNKQEVGRRLYLSACNSVYGEEILCSGPAYKSMYISGNKCILSFMNIGEGLIPNGNMKLSGFMISGADKRFFEAEAVIDGDKVIVSSNFVPYPVAVRYAWANYPHCNLYNMRENKYFLPASPFRTDDWPGLTYYRK